MAEKKKKRIFIHPDHIENLDETDRKLEEKKRDPIKTGYTTTCIIRNTEKRREILLKADFVREKIKSGVFFIFKVLNKEHQVMFQPVPIEFHNRTAVNHVERRFLGSLRRYGFRSDMHGTPEAATVLYNLGLSPQLEEYKFRLEEYSIRDAAFGDVYAYKFIPIGVV